MHRITLSSIRGELLREKEFLGILYMGYLLSIVKIKREIEREREREREERKRERGKKEKRQRERKERRESE